MKHANSYRVALTAILLISRGSISAGTVGSDGSYNEVIPIEAPEGRPGLTPKISLAYNSQSGNGLAGYGWQLKGIPVITRKNIGNGIRYAGADTYISDNGRLYDVSGNGTAYHSEKDDFSKYEPDFSSCGYKGLPSNEPCGWIVTDRMGTRYFFGLTIETTDRDDAYVEQLNGTAARMWALAKVVDLSGNYYSVNYYKFPSDGQIYPNVVAYGRGTSTSGQYVLRFEYSLRSDNYADKSLSTTGYTVRLLTNLYVEQSCFLVFSCSIKTYVLAHTYSGNTYLNNLSLIGGDGSTRNLFTYNYGWATTNYGASDIHGITDNRADFDPTSQQVSITGDFDGDGKQEIAWRRNGWTAWFTKLTSGTKTLIFGNDGRGDFFVDGAQKLFTGDFDGDGITDIAWRRNGWGGWLVNYGSGTNGWLMDDRGDFIVGVNQVEYVGDFNGDGKSDIVWRRDGWPHWLLNYGHGTNIWWGDDVRYDFTASSQQVHLPGDFDGDGKTDIAWRRDGWPLWIVDYGPGNVGYVLSDSRTDFGVGVQQVQFAADFDGDGKTDIAWRRSGWAHWIIGFGAGGFQYGLYDGHTDFLPEGSQIQFVGDFDGDGRSDIAWRRTGWGAWIANLGSGAVISLGSDGRTDFNVNYQQFHATGDFDGDGRTDLIWRRYNDANWNVNYGNGQNNSLFDGQTNFLQYNNLGQPHQAIHLFDWDGDGKTEIAWRITGSRQWHLSRMTGSNNMLRLSSVTNETGLITEIGYKATPQVSTFPKVNCGTGACGNFMTAPLTMVTSLTTRYGGTYYSNKSYAYRDPRIFGFGIDERIFLGFERIISVDSVTGDQVQSNYQIDPRFAMLMHSEIRTRNGIRINQTTINRNQYQCDESGCVQNDAFLLKAPKKVLEKSTVQYDLVNSIRETTTPIYDSYGNVIQTRTVRASTVHAAQMVKVQTTNFINSTQSPRAIGLACGGETFVKNRSEANLLSSNRAYFDGSDTPCSVTSGALLRVTRSDRYLGQGIWAPSYMTYDGFGNLSTRTDERGLTTNYTYETAFQLYPTSTILKSADNSKSFTTLSDTNTAYGFIASSTDVNGLNATQIADGFGRIIQASLNGEGEEKKRITTQYSIGQGLYDNYTTTCIYSGTGLTEGACARTYTDAFGREIIKIQPGLKDKAGNANQSTYVATRNEYNVLGQLVRQSKPYYVTDIADISTLPTLWIENQYDSIGRLVKVIKPTTSGTASVQVAYNNVPLAANAVAMTQTTDELGRVREDHIGVFGKPVFVRQAAGTADETVLTHVYNLKGQLVQAIAPQGVTNITYQNVTGQQLSVSDPMVGITSYTYFNTPGVAAFGQVQTETRPAPNSAAGDLITTTFEYNEPLGRLTRKSDSVTGAATTYTYDQVTSTYGLTRLTFVENREGGYIHRVQMGYDVYGNNASSVTDISHDTETLCSDPMALPCHSVVAQKFDGFGRKTEFSYPDLKKTQIQYAPGQMQALSLIYDTQTYASYSNFNELGQVGQLNYKNGTITNYSYDTTTGRMSELTTKDSQNRLIQDLQYGFYVDGTISTVNDQVITDASYGYTYDNLNRIKQASRGDGRIMNYGFDALSNLVQKDNRTLVFAAGTTRLVSSILAQTSGTVTTNFTWSPSGNMLTRVDGASAITYTYNAQNKLSRSQTTGGTTDGADTRYFYDAQGARFLKIYAQPGKQSVKTWYVGGIEMREIYADTTRVNFQLTRNIQGIDGQKLASITGSAGDLNLAMNAQGQFKIAAHYNGKLFGPGGSVTGYFSHSVHLFAAYTLTVNDFYAAHRRIVLLSLMVMLLLFTAWLIAQGETKGFMRRFVALMAAAAILNAGACSSNGGGGGASARFSITGTIAEIDALYTGLPQGINFYHSNHLGSSTVISDEAGIEKVRIHYLPYGEVDPALSGRYDQDTQQLVQAANGGTPTPTTVALFMSFTGQDFDPETELYDYKGRMYDPTIGMFTTADSIVPDPGDALAYNRYLYVNANPIMYTDPTGHEADWSEEGYDDDEVVHLASPRDEVSGVGNSTVNVPMADGDTFTMNTPPMGDWLPQGAGTIQLPGGSTMSITERPPLPVSAPLPHIPVTIQGPDYSGVATGERLASDMALVAVGAAAYFAGRYLGPQIASYVQSYGSYMATTIAASFAGTSNATALGAGIGATASGTGYLMGAGNNATWQGLGVNMLSGGVTGALGGPWSGLSIAGRELSSFSRASIAATVGLLSDAGSQTLLNGGNFNKVNPYQSLGAGVLSGFGTGYSSYMQYAGIRPLAADFGAGFSAIPLNAANNIIWGGR